MATKEDILEQIVEEYLIHKGYFVRHNVKFLPRKDHPEFVTEYDSNHSDIDVLGYNPKLTGVDAVMAVSCKSWQQGFSPRSEISAIEQEKIRRGRKAWQAFRELTKPKWSEAFIEAVREETGTTNFTYVTAVSRIRGRRADWEEHEPFRAALGGNPIRIWTFEDMVLEVYRQIGTTLAATEVGRLLQMFRASDITLGQRSPE